MVALILYTYPAFVTVAAIALGRAGAVAAAAVALTRRLGRGRARAAGRPAPAASSLVGALLALGAALTYATYILVSDPVIGEVDPFALALLVLTGATASFAVVGLATGSLDLALPGEAWLWLVLIALVSTVVAVSAFFAGLRRVGPSEAAILSTFEPVVAGARLLRARRAADPVQLAGGALCWPPWSCSAARSGPPEHTRAPGRLADSSGTRRPTRWRPPRRRGGRRRAAGATMSAYRLARESVKSAHLGELVRVLEVDGEEALASGPPAQRPAVAGEPGDPHRHPGRCTGRGRKCMASTV